MKRISVMLILFIMICASVVISAEPHSETKSYGWYCKNNKTHTQPELDSPLSFIEKYDAYYIDRRHGDNNEEKVLYLTFDAGYENGNVEKILNVLKDEDVPGAFFVLDNLIIRNTDLVKRMTDEGHLVCNHTKNHKDMSRLDKEEFAGQITELEEIYRRYTGKELSKYYRPPEGKFSEQNLMYASELGYKTIFWSFAYADWDNESAMEPEKAKEKVLSHTHNGSVILLHPTSAVNAEIIPDLIKEWKSQGYRFGTLDELTQSD